MSVQAGEYSSSVKISSASAPSNFAWQPCDWPVKVFQPSRMVATVSAGNHGQGFAQACRLKGVTVHVVMPKPIAALNHRAILGFGTQVHVFENRSRTDARLRELVDGYQPVVIQPYTICSL